MSNSTSAGWVVSILAEHFDDQSAWREAKQEEYPQDSRNGACASALAELAGFTRKLPDSEPVLARFAEFGSPDPLDGALSAWLGYSGDSGIAEYGSPAWLVSRYGFDGPVSDHRAFLEELAGAIEHAAEEMDREREAQENEYRGGGTPSGTRTRPSRLLTRPCSGG
jgi:hypothetical protein